MTRRTRNNFVKIFAIVGSAVSGGYVAVFGGIKIIPLIPVLAWLAGMFGFFAFTGLGYLLMWLEKRLEQRLPAARPGRAGLRLPALTRS